MECEDSTYYVRKKRIGEGTYAVIYEAIAFTSSFNGDSKILKEAPPHYKESKKVAIKKIKKIKEAEGIELNALREITALKLLQCEYILKLEEVFLFNGNINIVLEYVESDLEAVIKNKNIILMPGDIKRYIFMITRGLHELHSLFLVHRDLKPNNILLTKSGIVKIADFGLTRHISENEMSVSVITRWYRPPELIMGGKLYTTAVDIWGLGTIFAELLLRVPLFAGESDFEQLDLIFKVLGTPTTEEWPLMVQLPNYLQYQKYEKGELKNIFKGVSNHTLELLEGMLIYDPAKRSTTLNILSSEYFKVEPYPTLSEDLNKIIG